MANYNELVGLLNSGSRFLSRVHWALLDAAVDVTLEDPQTPNHANRLIWAGQVFADPPAMIVKMKTRVLVTPAVLDAETNPAADEAWRDAKVQEAVDGLINTFAIGS